MTIQILGTGCPSCRALEENARKAAAGLGIEADFVKITDLDRIMDMGALVTPALAVDGEVKSCGKLLDVGQISELLSPRV